MAQRLADRAGDRTLRSQLVGLVLLLVASALFIAGAAAVTALRGYLLDRVDEGLTSLAASLARPGDPLAGPTGDDAESVAAPSRPGPVGPDVLYVARGDATGGTPQPDDNAEAVADPPRLPALSLADAQAWDGQPYDVDSVSGESRWRVVTLPTSDGSGTISAAQDVSGIHATVSRLILIELAIGAVVLLLSGVLGSYLVRRSLRPLATVEATAAAIAAGDRGRRAPVSDSRTEVGSLAASFNTMVDDLSGALTAQQASEQVARAAADRAVASEDRMRQFIADAGHELRTPLTSVRGFAELYRIGGVRQGRKLDEAMSRIEAEAARMGVIVDDLVLLARLDQPRPLELESVDVAQLVAEAAVAARAAARDRVIRVRVSDAATGLSVPGDPHRLRQVLDNLLSNAMRYSPAAAPVDVLVDLRPTAPEPAQWASVEVTDRGTGMSEDVTQRVFERFYRADTARSRARGGSGLGLAIVAAIVAAHDGRVEVSSEVGTGSTFQVLLPLR